MSSDKKDNENTLSIFRRLESMYLDHPSIGILIEIIASILPLGSAINEGITRRLLRLREDRLEILLDELSKGKLDLTDDVIESNDFLHTYISTLNAVIHTRQKEKIRLIARLFRNTVNRRELHSERFEELLQILDTLSLRELCVLRLLKRFEESQTQSANASEIEKNDVQLAESFWSEFEKEAMEECAVLQEELPPLLTRLTRTGLYENITGSYLDYAGGRGKTTYLLDVFLEWVESETS